MTKILKENVIFANRYRLVEFLGNGKSTEVWHALDTFANVNVAIKFYINLTNTDEVLRKYAMVFGINHTNILHPVYVGSHDGMTYVIMQYCKNGNVAKYIAEKRRFKEEICWKILHDVSSGLAYLHGLHTPILHLDIKPDNVLIQENGSYMITDFGISEYFDEDNIKSVNGTVAYMAPERFMENNPPVKANDIWSLGAMMFEIMSAGELPFGEMGGTLQTSADPIPQVTGDYSSELKQMVYKCLSYYPWERLVAKDISTFSYNKLLSYRSII